MTWMKDNKYLNKDINLSLVSNVRKNRVVTEPPHLSCVKTNKEPETYQ